MDLLLIPVIPKLLLFQHLWALVGHTLLRMPSRLYIEEMRMAKNGRPFQMAFLDQVEQQLLCLLQIPKLRENSMLLTTVVYLSRPIQVFHGGNLTFNGQMDIPYNLLGLLWLGPDLAASRSYGDNTEFI